MPGPKKKGSVVIRAYTSPTLVFLAFDWADGAKHADFLGFSIRRNPGYGKSGAPQYLFNKVDFKPLAKGAKPPTSDKAPIQKFNWWDGGLGLHDAGKSFSYVVTPILGSGPGDLRPVSNAAAKLTVKVPRAVESGIGTYFNRAVVSSQAYARIKSKPLEARMTWLANGIDQAVPQFLAATRRFDCGIYHLTDKWRIVPSMKKFTGAADTVYFFRKKSPAGKGGDATDVKARALLESAKRKFHERTHIKSLMHDKYIVGYKDGKPNSLLMGSMNFTPEAATVQANVVHTFASPALARLYAARHALLAPDPTMKDTVKHAGWLTVKDVPKTRLRVFFAPEPAKQRKSLDAVVAAVKSAKSSVMFCMFAPTDAALLKAMLDVGDKGKIMYGLLNSVPDPAKAKKTGKPPSASQKIMVEVYNRSRKDHKTTTYDYFRPGSQPQDFLPELSTVNTASFSLSPPPGNVPAVHVHHKFIVIDGDTKHPTIYTGSANMSLNSTNYNDENLLEIKNNETLAQIYVAEFMRLYNHYHARAVWEYSHGKNAKHRVRRGSAQDPILLKRTRDEWAKGAYKTGTAAFAARVRLAGG